MQPILPFLRPLGPPKPATIRHFLRFSTSSPTRAASSECSHTYANHPSLTSANTSSPALDPNLVASQTAPASYPPPSLKSIPRPVKSHASHRTSQPTKIRNYPDRVKQSSPSLSSDATPAPVLAESQVAPNLPYYVTRTPSNELPIYHLRKRGGNLRQTRVKKISGSIDALRDALQTELAVPEKECVINRTTNHVVVKGWHKPKIESFLTARKF